VIPPAIECEIDQRKRPNASLTSRHSGQPLTYDFFLISGDRLGISQEKAGPGICGMAFPFVGEDVDRANGTIITENMINTFFKTQRNVCDEWDIKKRILACYLLKLKEDSIRYRSAAKGDGSGKNYRQPVIYNPRSHSMGSFTLHGYTARELRDVCGRAH
jgi:hypothetical protein